MGKSEIDGIREVLGEIKRTVTKEEMRTLLPVWDWKNSSDSELQTLLAIVAYDGGAVFFGTNNTYPELKVRALGLFERVKNKPEICLTCYPGYLSAAKTWGIMLIARPLSCGVFPCLKCKRFDNPLVAGLEAVRNSNARLVSLGRNGKYYEVYGDQKDLKPLKYSTESGEHEVQRITYDEWKAQGVRSLEGLHPFLVSNQEVIRHYGFGLKFGEFAVDTLRAYDNAIRAQNLKDLQL